MKTQDKTQETQNKNQPDMLHDIFVAQQKLDSYIRQKRNLNYTKEEWAQKKSLAMIDEIAELLNELNYKWWKNPKEINNDLVAGELVDILHFWTSVCLDFGLTAKDIHKIYFDKNKENFNRQDGLSEKEGYN